MITMQVWRKQARVTKQETSPVFVSEIQLRSQGFKNN